MSFNERKPVFRLQTKSKVQPVLPQETTAIQYASTWFKNNVHKKPNLLVSYKNVSLDLLLKHAANGLETGDLTGELATAVLYRVFKDEKHQLPTDWTSFGVIIGKSGEEINPWALMDVQEKDGILPNTEVNKDVGLDDANWIAFYICFMYRFARATNQAYKDALADRAEEHAKNLNPKSVRPQPPAMTKMQALILHAPYNAAIAGIDMFYHKFKTSKLASVRYGTLPSRFKDCAALTTLNHITRLTGLPIEQFMLWVFSARMADELDQMSKPEEELDKGDSYVAYMREMGISERSPYSSQANPAFSLFCHVVGTLLGSRRSKNARMGLEVDTVNSVINGKIVAYVLGTRPTFTLEYSTDPNQEVEVSTLETLDLSKIPTSSHPEEWYGYLSINGFKVPPEAEKWIESRLHTLADLRDGTVGKFLKTQK
ncbi:nucleoprotein [Mount Elgon bat virus]|uniref:Nucleoprotein n=2 Tax=Mount Elgon bat virus TaxID=380434 RepID=A0A0D3R2C4_9RHAB|nr:nucleoprotein [Mount Elgon bat virus]AJR28607.1 nucleoprotein [Mount Elgon bat virus]